MEDKRFAHIATDPKFRRIPKGERKVKIDKRFQSMFKDKKFKVKYTVDKRGRPVNHSTSEDLKRYYELSSESEEESENDDEKVADRKDKKEKGSKDRKGTEVKIKRQAEYKDDKQTEKINIKQASFIKGGVEKHNSRENANKNSRKTNNKNEDLTSDKEVNSDEELNSEKSSGEEEESNSVINSDQNEELNSDLNSGEESDDLISINDGDNKKVKKSASLNKKKQKDKVDDNSLNQTLKTDKEIPNKVKRKLKNLKIDYARGEGKLLSDSSSDDESEEEEISDSEGIDHKWGELDADAEPVEEPTRRLAACNMDWDRIRATDLMVLFNSFLPPGARIESVKIYTSEFGKRRLAEEDIKGPIELVESKEENEETEEGAKYHMEKLRQYQLNRLKYYYAVITCDSASTGNKIYTECDGMEYESSATKIDLRFIPDEMDFEDEPKEICEKIPELNKYKPRFFTTTALQQAKVDLTWDETDPERLEIAQKLASGKVDEISENDLQAYLASSSGEEDEEEDVNEEEIEDDTKNPIDKYKALLQEIESKEKARENRDLGMEISWGIDLENKTEKLVKKKLEEQESKTPFQKYLDKRKEKRKLKKETKKQKDEEDKEDSDVPSDIDMNDPYFAEEFNKPEFKNKFKKKEEKIVSDTEDEDEQRNAELELLLMNEEEENKKHFSLKKIQDGETEGKKKKKRRGKNSEEDKSKDDFKINVDDDRFSALFTSHHYNIDPTDSHFKKTKNMEVLIEEKIKRRNFEEDGPEPKKVKSGKKKAELSVLVKSVKRKAEAFANKK